MTEITPLTQLLDFTPQDLADNRNGRISEMQDYRLRLRRRRVTLIGLAIMLFAILAASLCIFLGNRNDTPIMTFIGIGLTICSAALMGTFVRFWLRLHTDITNGQVQKISGRLERVLKPVNRQVMTYVLRIDATEIVVPKEAFKAFEHEAMYCLYRAPYSGTLLAAERLSSDGLNLD